MENQLAKLVCGDFQNHPTVEDVYENLYRNISKFEKLIKGLANLTEEEITVLGPFYGRSLLETVGTALVGRIDPFRIIVVKNVQQQDTFGLGSRSKSAINWFGDIFEEGIKDIDKEPKKMWNPNKAFSSIGRGLFGDYYGYGFWMEAYKRTLDETVERDVDFLDYYRRTVPPEKFMLYIRQEASSLYSSLSKGVHSEIVINPEILYDRTTVFELLSKTVGICSFIALVSHKIDTSINLLPFDSAQRYFIDTKEWSENYGV